MIQTAVMYYVVYDVEGLAPVVIKAVIHPPPTPTSPQLIACQEKKLLDVIRMKYEHN